MRSDASEPDPLAGRTVLHYACAPNPGTKPGANLPVLRKLFDHGAERFINRPSSTGDTPLMVAARRGDAEARTRRAFNAALHGCRIDGSRPAGAGTGPFRAGPRRYLKRNVMRPLNRS